jgi:hypothetical protein
MMAMRSYRLLIGVAAALTAVCTAFAADPAIGEKGASVPVEMSSKKMVKPVSEAAKRFVRQPVWSGTFDNMPMQATFRLKRDFEDGLEGEYFIFGQSQHILLAGEFDAEGISLEESENGRDVSGRWEGMFEGDVLRGNWSSIDGSVMKPFVLKALPAQSNAKKPRATSPVSRTTDKQAIPTKSNTKP